MLPLKYSNNFWRNPEMPLINCKVNLIFTWSENSVIVYTDAASQGATFSLK